ncbi:MAG: PhoH family protein [Actinobacteria bacterium]|nr:PhoH family protein [Actinomycetota bacterium]MCI0542844.1 PhoH family protein [Actinomycetota bacterium]MCI0677601.1 PhoH family protein [Actinomycetota bacterium]
MGSTFVLDTCVLLADPRSILRFDEHDVVLPLVVVEELDRQKGRMDEVGTGARGAIRLLEELGASRDGGLRDPVRLPGGGTLRIELNGILSERLPAALDPRTPDHRILATCLNLDDDPVLVTKDAALRIKGAQLGVRVQDYRADTVSVERVSSGITEHQTDSATIDILFEQGKIELAGVDAAINEFLVLRNGTSRSALARVVQTDPTCIVERVPTHVRAFGVEPKNVAQTVALHQMLDVSIPAVSLMGMAGTGKTFLALAAALEQVLEQPRYRRVSVYRPLVAVGRQEVGFLPGDLNEKLTPWMAAVHDNLYALFSDGGPEAARGAIEELVDRGELEMAAVTYLRGRSITGEFVIIDEAQNLELPTLKVILTRMSRDSKVVFCGDLSQVDNPYISPYGGMAALIERFRGSPLFAHVTLERSVRSPLSEMAATIL